VSLFVFATVAFAEGWMYRHLTVVGSYLVWTILFIALGGGALGSHLGLSHVDAIAATLAEVKKVAKAISGCSFVLKTSDGIVDLARSADSRDASGAA
jgi:hypothetical protein